MTNSTAVSGYGNVTATAAEELEAYDRLGPSVRAALGACVFKWSAIGTLNKFKRSCLDPQNPAHDRYIADQLLRIDADAARTRAA